MIASATPYTRKGKQYISKKAPADIAFMYPDWRYRLSTGTSDRAVANAKAHEYLRKIEDHFDHPYAVKYITKIALELLNRP